MQKFFALTRTGRVLDRYYRHDVARESAALTYYLFFALFPLLVFVSTLLGLLNLDVAGITGSLSAVLPRSFVELTETYLTYVTENQNGTLMWFSLFFSVYFPYRAANLLMRSVRRAYHVKRPKNLLRYTGKVLIFTVLLLATIFVGFAVAVLGRNLMTFLNRYVTIDPASMELWLNLRFLLLTAIVWAMVTISYGLSLDERVPLRELAPGTVLAVLCWLLTTFGFSYYVEHFSNYSIIYGSIGAIVAVLIWLNLSSMLMIMGAEVNVLLTERRERKQRKEEEDERI